MITLRADQALSKRRIALLVAGFVLVAGITAFGHFPKHGDHNGFWSILPPAVAIILAFATREVVSSLFIGVALGGVISGKLNIVQEYLIPSIAANLTR